MIRDTFVLISLSRALLYFVISKILWRQGDKLQLTIFLNFDVQSGFAHFSVTMNPSEAVLYAKLTGVSSLYRHIESRS